MLRTVLGLALAFALGAAVVTACEMLGVLTWPTPGLASDDPSAERIAIASIPPAALFAILVGWALGAFVAAFVAARVTLRAWAPQSIVVVFLAFALLNMMILPRPLWMWVGAIVTVPLAGWFGGHLARQAKPL